MNQRFIIQPSQEPGFWVATDTEHNIVVKFREHQFNETQEITLLNGETISSQQEAMKYATYLRELADWLRDNHYEKAMPEISKTKKSNMKCIENLQLQMIQKLMEHYIITLYNDINAKVLSINVDSIDVTEDESELISAEILCNGTKGTLTLEWSLEDEEFVGSCAEKDENGVQYDFFGYKHQEFTNLNIPLSSCSDGITLVLGTKFVKDVSLVVPVSSVTLRYPSDGYQFIDEVSYTSLFEFVLNIIPEIRKKIIENKEISSGYEIEDLVIDSIDFCGNGHSAITIGLK